MPNKIWQRWKRLAHRAAELQAIVILSIVYWVIVAPIGALMRLGRRPADAAAVWTTRPPSGPVPIEEARRQS
jgi:hypothetical protein